MGESRIHTYTEWEAIIASTVFFFFFFCYRHVFFSSLIDPVPMWERERNMLQHTAHYCRQWYETAANNELKDCFSQFASTVPYIMTDRARCKLQPHAQYKQAKQTRNVFSSTMIAVLRCCVVVCITCCIVCGVCNNYICQIFRTWAESQQIVAQRPLSCVQYLVRYLSRLQRICLLRYLIDLFGALRCLYVVVVSNKARLYDLGLNK
jgi:hypothetical protein